MADPKSILSKQQIKDTEEYNRLLEAQPRLLRSISGIWDSIVSSIAKSESTTEKIVDNSKAYLGIAKQVLSTTGDIHKETVDWADINEAILESQKSGNTQLTKQYKQLGRIQKVQKGYNNLVNAGVNSVDKMVDGVNNLVREIPVIGDFLADFINFDDIKTNMTNSFREGAKVSGGIFGDILATTAGNVGAEVAAKITGMGDEYVITAAAGDENTGNVGADATAAAGDEEGSAAVGKEQDICDCIGKEAKEGLAAEGTGDVGADVTAAASESKPGWQMDAGEIFERDRAAAEAASEAAEGIEKVGQENEKVDKTSGQVTKKWGKMKLLAFGIGAAVAAMAASMVKFAFETGLSLGQMIEMGPALAINQKYVSAMAEEFGTINDVNWKTAKALKIQSLVYGIQSDQAVKILRIQTALSDSSHEQLINVQNSVAQFARMKGVLPSKVFEDIAGSTELMAKHAHGSAEEFMRAAVEIRAMGVGLDVADQIATHLLDIEGSINAQFEANAVLGRSMNFDTARRLMMQDDLTGMMEEIKRQVGGEAAFQKLNRLERELLSKSIGTDVTNLAKLVTQEEKASAAVENQKNKWVAIGGIVLALVGAMIGAMAAIPGVGALFTAKGLAGMAFGAAAGGALGVELGARYGGAAPPKAHDGGQVEVKSGEVILNELQQNQLKNSDPQLVAAITDLSREMKVFGNTLRNGQIQSSKQRQSLIDVTAKGQEKVYRGITE